MNQRKQFTENASVALQQTILMHVLTKCPPVLEIRSYKYSTLLYYDCKDNKWVNYGRLWICCILPNNRASGIMVFFQQIIHYLLANYVPKIPNDAQIMRIVQYCTIFLSESSQCFNILKKKKKKKKNLPTKYKHLINI